LVQSADLIIDRGSKTSSNLKVRHSEIPVLSASYYNGLDFKNREIGY
jgi:hypothetical protein